MKRKEIGKVLKRTIALMGAVSIVGSGFGGMKMNALAAGGGMGAGSFPGSGSVTISAGGTDNSVIQNDRWGGTTGATVYQNDYINLMEEYGFIAFTSATLDGHQHTNIATAELLSSGNELNIRNKYENSGTISYVEQFGTSANFGSYGDIKIGTGAGDNKTNGDALIVGDGYTVRYNGTESFVKDSAGVEKKVDAATYVYTTNGGIKWIDLTAAKNTFKEYSAQLAGKADTIGIDYSSYGDNSIGVINVPSGSAVQYLSVDASNIYKFNADAKVNFEDSDSTTVLVVNVDMNGMSWARKAFILDASDNSIGYGENVYTHKELNRIYYNFYDSSKADQCYTGSIGMQDKGEGIIICPAGYVEIGSNWCGTVVADRLNARGETHRIKELLHVIPYAATTPLSVDVVFGIQHWEVKDDGTGKRVSSQVSTFDSTVYSTSYEVKLLDIQGNQKATTSSQTVEGNKDIGSDGTVKITGIPVYPGSYKLVMTYTEDPDEKYVVMNNEIFVNIANDNGTAKVTYSADNKEFGTSGMGTGGPNVFHLYKETDIVRVDLTDSSTPDDIKNIIDNSTIVVKDPSGSISTSKPEESGDPAHIYVPTVDKSEIETTKTPTGTTPENQGQKEIVIPDAIVEVTPKDDGTDAISVIVKPDGGTPVDFSDAKPGPAENPTKPNQPVINIKPIINNITLVPIPPKPAPTPTPEEKKEETTPTPVITIIPEGTPVTEVKVPVDVVYVKADIEKTTDLVPSTAITLYDGQGTPIQTVLPTMDPTTGRVTTEFTLPVPEKGGTSYFYISESVQPIIKNYSEDVDTIYMVTISVDGVTGHVEITYTNTVTGEVTDGVVFVNVSQEVEDDGSEIDELDYVPTTGDNTNFIIFGIVGFITLCGAAMVILSRKQKEQE